MFSKTVSIVKSSDSGYEWKQVVYRGIIIKSIRFWIKSLVFDAPYIEKPFEQRMAFLNEYFSSEEGKKAKYVQLVEHEKCQGSCHGDTV